MNDCNISTFETAWCPGCGNQVILDALKETLISLGKKPHEVLIVGGIGQSGKTPQYLNTNGFSSLHGRALSSAVAAKIVNKDMTVIVNSGDGDSYSEGGNHFIHNIRRNVDITHFVHNNQIYGLTKGQASPTTDAGHITQIQPYGSNNIPINPLLLAISLGAGFVARAFSGDKEQLKQIMNKAINYKGYSLVDILQPCISFNKINTFKWYSNRIYKLEDDYDRANKLKAIERSMQWGDNIPLGILYEEIKPNFHDKIDFLRDGDALINRNIDLNNIKGFMQDFI